MELVDQKASNSASKWAPDTGLWWAEIGSWVNLWKGFFLKVGLLEVVSDTCDDEEDEEDEEDDDEDDEDEEEEEDEEEDEEDDEEEGVSGVASGSFGGSSW